MVRYDELDEICISKIKKTMSNNSTAKTHILMIRVSPDMKDEINKLANKSRRSTSDYIRLLLEDAISEAKANSKSAT